MRARVCLAVHAPCLHECLLLLLESYTLEHPSYLSFKLCSSAFSRGESLDLDHSKPLQRDRLSLQDMFGQKHRIAALCSSSG